MHLVLVVAHFSRNALLLGLKIALDLLIALLVEQAVLGADGDAERLANLFEVARDLWKSVRQGTNKSLALGGSFLDASTTTIPMEYLRSTKTGGMHTRRPHHHYHSLSDCGPAG